MEAKLVNGDESRVFSMMGVTIRVRASASDTGGAVTVLEQTVAPGGGSPLHTVEQDKIVLVLEGAVAVTIGDSKRPCSPGATAFIPRGVPHCFANDGQAPAQILVLTTPGGHEEFLREASEAMGGPTPSREAFRAACARHGVGLVGGPAT